jgi:hypothetical protein
LQAIIWATTEWKVDIIVMPFGFEHEVVSIAKAIQFAHFKNIIMIAAASDPAGLSRAMSWPGRMAEVIGVFATNSYGMPSSFNPDMEMYGENFATLGEVVKIPFLRNGRKSGTSVATTVAGGIAALVLDFAAQYVPESSLSTQIWSHRGMRAIFRLMATPIKADLYYLCPWVLLGAGKGEEQVLAMILVALHRDY